MLFYTNLTMRIEGLKALCGVIDSASLGAADGTVRVSAIGKEDREIPVVVTRKGESHHYEICLGVPTDDEALRHFFFDLLGDNEAFVGNDQLRMTIFHP